MAKKYLIWKTNGMERNPNEWVEVSGNDFFCLFNSPESKGRFFIVLDNDICADADVLYIEATEEQYKEWYKENCHHLYLKRFQPKNGLLSLDALMTENELSSLHEIVADTGVDIESQVVHSELLALLPDVLRTLNDLGKEAIFLKFFQYPELSDREIAEKIGIAEKAFVKRKDRALKKIATIIKK